MGNIGGPGRPKGSRNKLAEDFLDKAYEKWLAKGDAAFDHMADNEPVKFIQLMALLIPAHFKVEHEHTGRFMTDEQIKDRIIELTASVIDEPPREVGGARRIGRRKARRERRRLTSRATAGTTTMACARAA